MSRLTPRTASRITTLILFTAILILLVQLATFYKSQCFVQTRDRASLANTFIKSRSLFSQTEPPESRPVIRSTTSYVKTPVGKPKRWLTIGIPTIQRRDGSYFLTMLDSMINNTSDEQMKRIYIIVFLADFNKTEWKASLEDQLRSKYSQHFESGALEVINAPEEFYSGFNASKMPSQYMYWRTKQNFDYSYIMQYGKELSDFYMQMEDDVITKEGYLDSIQDYIKEQEHDGWICLEFSELGFIGKLYHARDLYGLTQMFEIFSETNPVDFIFLYFNQLKGQGPRIIRKPTLFQHIGYHSSLPDKIQGLKDIFYDLPSKKYTPDNPEADVYTTLPTFSQFYPKLAYLNEVGFFWGSASGKQGDTFTVIFKTMQTLDRVIVETGAVNHETDVISVGVVEVSSTLSDVTDPPNCKDYKAIGMFLYGLVNITDISAKLGGLNTKCLQIKIIQNQIPWVIVREIAVWTHKDKTN